MIDESTPSGPNLNSAPSGSRSPAGAIHVNDFLARLKSARKILVLGPSGSGKTTLTLELARVLEIEPIHLDAHFWQTGWRPTPKSQWLDQVRELVERREWIMDGTYEDSLPVRIRAAEAAIVLERSRWTCLYRVFKRKLFVDDRRRPDAPPGQPVDRAFLRYIWNYPSVTRPVVWEYLREHGDHLTIVTLQNSREAASLIRGLHSSRSPAAPIISESSVSRYRQGKTT